MSMAPSLDLLRKRDGHCGEPREACDDVLDASLPADVDGPAH